MVYDAVVVGASISGCTAATLLGRAGRRVALVERSRDVDAYKAMCGHWILGGAKPTLERAGLWEPMVAAGADVAWMSVWGGDGWIDTHVDDVPPAISLRRQTLDPLLRRIAAETPGVELRLGATVTAVTRDAADAVVGVEVNGSDRVEAPLVIGADGHRSATARLAGVEESCAPNGRFFWWAYYEGLSLGGHGARVWPADPDGAVVTPAGEGLHLVGAFPSKIHLVAFAGDRVAALERYMAALPDAPDLARARRVSRAIGTNDYPFVRRDPVPLPGLALIGDAAMASDPLPAVGCGWAFRSAEWLADAVLAGRMEDYRDAHAFARQHDDLARADAADPKLSEPQRALRRAAVHDRDLARRLGLFAARAVGPEILFSASSV